MEVLDVDVANRFLFVSIHKDGIVIGFLCHNVLYAEVFVLGCVLPATETEVVGFEAQDGAFAPLNGDVVYKDIADVSATVAVRFEVDGILHRTNLYVVHIDILHTTRHFATDAQTVALGIEQAITDHDVPRCPTDTTSIGIASGLDGYGVIAGTESTIFNQHIASRFRVASVIIWEMAIDSHATHNDIATIHRMDGPERRVLNGNTLYQDACASQELDTGWA